MITEALEFSREIATESVDDGGFSLSIKATKEELGRLAERFNLVSLDRLSAEITLTPERGGKWIRLKGSISAVITQNCVVSLEPFESIIEDTLERVFDTTLMDGRKTEEDFEFDGEDPPDPAAEGIINVGEVVAEQLALEIDPFPRKPGVSSSDYPTAQQGDGASSPENGEAEKNSPFGVLEKLKKKLK